MSIILRIEDDNKSYAIIDWKYRVIKDIDSKGRGSAKPLIENFVMKVENDRLETIMSWITTPQLYKSRIYVIEDPSQSKGRKVTTEFVDVRCTNYQLDVDGVWLELNAAGFRREDVAYESYWKTTTFTADQSTEVTTREEEEEIEPTNNGPMTMDEVGGEGTKDSPKEIEQQGTKDKRPKFKAPKSLIDVPEVPNPKKIDGIIYPNAPKIPKTPKIPEVPKLPELSEDALKNIPENMQGVITDYPDDVLADAADEAKRQDIIIAAANLDDDTFKEKAIEAGKKLLSKAITTIAIAGIAYAVFDTGRDMVKQVESVGKFLKKVF